MFKFIVIGISKTGTNLDNTLFEIKISFIKGRFELFHIFPGIGLYLLLSNVRTRFHILAGMYGGTQTKKRSQHVQGMKALKATGGNFAFDFPAQKVNVEAKRPDGAFDVAKVSVIAVVTYLIMKTAALGRGKAKDAYDIYFLLKHFRGGAKEIAKEFLPVGDRKLVQDMKEKLAGKFASANHAGPVDVAEFLELDGEEEIEMMKRDVYEQVQALLRLI